MKIIIGTGEAAVQLSWSLKGAIGKDKARPHLQQVEVSSFAFGDGDTGAQFVTTDAYRCHRVRLWNTSESLPSGHVCAVPEPVQVYGAEFVAALAAVGRAARKTGTVTVAEEWRGGPASVVTVSGGGITQDVATSSMSFPNTAALFTDSDEMESGATFDGSFAAQLFDAADDIARIGTGKGSVSRGVNVLSMSVRKCCHVSAASVCGTVTFDGLLMPQRVTK